VGPIAHQGRAIAATIADPSFTAVLAVTTAEEMPVNETLWLRDALAAEALPLDGVIVNARYPERFTVSERDALAGARDRATSSLTRGALAAAISEQARASSQTAELGRLAEGLGLLPLVELPYLFAENMGPGELELLADALDRGLREPAPAEVHG
jgi:anion-transporting  ArsA/GET3 family ATPase